MGWASAVRQDHMRRPEAGRRPSPRPASDPCGRGTAVTRRGSALSPAGTGLALRLCYSDRQDVQGVLEVGRHKPHHLLRQRVDDVDEHGGEGGSPQRALHVVARVVDKYRSGAVSKRRVGKPPVPLGPLALGGAAVASRLLPRARPPDTSKSYARRAMPVTSAPARMTPATAPKTAPPIGSAKPHGEQSHGLAHGTPRPGAQPGRRRRR